MCNIGAQAFSVGPSRSRELQPELYTNADEADLRVWLDCKNSFGQHKLIYSPDTDVYHIGLSEAPKMPDCDIIVQLQLRKGHTDEARCVHMNLLMALQNDPDLSLVTTCIRPGIIQSTYVLLVAVITSLFSMDW